MAIPGWMATVHDGRIRCRDTSVHGPRSFNRATARLNANTAPHRATRWKLRGIDSPMIAKENYILKKDICRAAAAPRGQKAVGPRKKIKGRRVCHYESDHRRHERILYERHASSNVRMHAAGAEQGETSSSVLDDGLRDMDSIEDAVSKAAAWWPEWSSNGFWLIKPDGRQIEIGKRPSPNEAAIFLRRLWNVYIAERSRSSMLPVTPSSLPLVKGLVECLLLSTPRYPSCLSFKGHSGPCSSSERDAAFGYGMQSKHASTQQNERTNLESASANADVADATSCNRDLDLNESCFLSDQYVSKAFSALALLAVGNAMAWSKDMDILCDRIPTNPYISTSISHIYRVSYALSRVRHWTPYIQHLERSAASCLRAMRLGKGDCITTSSEASTHRIGRIARCFASLGYKPMELFHEISLWLDCNSEGQELDYSEKENVINLCWSLAITDALDAPLLNVLLRRLVGFRPSADFEASHLSMLHQFFLTLRVLRPDVLRDWQEASLAGSNLRRACEAAWNRQRETMRTISSSQSQVYGTLRQMNVAADGIIELEASVCGLSVDIVCEQKNLVIEVDGPMHVGRNDPTKIMGSTMWKRRLLEHLGWRVVNVNTRTWNATLPSNRVHLLSRLINE